MTRFSDELRIIPMVARIFAILIPIGGFIGLFAVLSNDPKVGQWPLLGRVAFSIWPGLLVGVLVLFYGYINADARRRGMRYVMWTLLAMFVPNTLGIILYFILREPLQAQCPKCGAPGRVNFTFCPQCGAELSTACPSCKRAVEPGWKSCPYCRSALGAGAPRTA
ncbi:MAG TPA: zinc ribbon domain-containing protein [Terriglobales bacterium]